MRYKETEFHSDAKVGEQVATSGNIHLLTLSQLQSLPTGTKLTNLNGTRAVVGESVIGTDTRGAYIGCGFFEDELPDGYTVDRHAIRQITKKAGRVETFLQTVLSRKAVVEVYGGNQN